MFGHVCVCVLMWLFGCQDVPSFGGFLSRCSIFRQGESSCARSCMCVCSCGSLAVKMFHLSAASCQDAPSLGRESHPVFGHVCVCVFMWLFGCQDVPSFGGFLSRCSIFRQGILCSVMYVCVCSCGSLAVKMFHLSAASCQDAPSLGRESYSVFSHVCVCVCVHVALWLSRCCLSAASCQDAPSLGRESHSVFSHVCVCVCSRAVKMFQSCAINMSLE